jgi:isocitrate/isopropylmalate dehydrogenase
MAAAAIRNTLKIGMIPADGIGREVLPVRFRVYRNCCVRLP